MKQQSIFDEKSKSLKIQTEKLGWNYRKNRLAIPAWHELGEVKKSGSMVLDPMCGGSTTCYVALTTGRRFIGIDINPWAIECAWHRCQEAIEKGDAVPMRAKNGEPHKIIVKQVFKSEAGLAVPAFRHKPIDWDSGHSYLIHGDCLQILQTMPKEIVDLIYIDPPFNSDKDYKAGETFFKWIQKQRSKRPWPNLGQEKWKLPG